MAAREPTAKRQPKKKRAAADETEVPTAQETGTTTVERLRSADGQNR